jgi:prepilin-type N-terminal cleavage/methylation domain-containing protein
MLKLKGQKGFTLIELLIVIAILGILAAVIIPSISGMTTTAKLAAANTELASVQTAAIAYLADNPTDIDGFDETALSGYVSDDLEGTYDFDANGKLLDDPAPTYPSFFWNPETKQFQKTAIPEE